MNSMTEIEIDQCLNEIDLSIDWELDQVVFNEKVIQFHFSHADKFFWFNFSMKPGTPYIFSATERVYLVKNLKKPLGLFIKTHFLGRHLVGFKRLSEKGRVILMSLSGDADIELTMIPGRLNVEARLGDKKVSANKPKPIPEQTQASDYEPREARGNGYFLAQWQKQFEKTKVPEKDEQKIIKKELKKKTQGLEKMQKKLDELLLDPWRQLAEHLSHTQSMDDVPSDLNQYLDSQLDLIGNIENGFNQSKKNKAKIAGTKERIEELKKELIQLEKGERSQKKTSESLLKVAEIKGRTYDLDGFKLYIGKSSKDNLSLLRKAKAWYLWLHIKDYPGAYGIIERNKNAKIPSKTIEQAALMVIKNSLPSDANGRYEALYAECRYVRPIKGAKSGQVTYSHEKVLGIRVE